MTSAPTYPKRLIEVDLPIKAISTHSRREKSIRHGHISTLHIWWARRPLAACRAVTCAALWPDPFDELCPQSFRDAAAKALVAFADLVRSDPKLAGLVKDHWTRWKRTDASTWRPTDPSSWPDMRYALLDFIADFANWDASTVPAFLETARALTQAAHEGLGGKPGTRPLVVDPFAGGGSIPLEALRVGADAFASDLNPVAVLLNKVVLEYIPKYGQQLADEVRKWGQWVKEQAESELAQFYPKDQDGATPMAYLWARTVLCEGPGCGAEVPLIRSLWLAKKANRSVALRLVPDRATCRVDFEILANVRAVDVGEGTVRRGSATCPVCGYSTPVTSVRAQLKSRRGGAMDARMYCVVTTRQGQIGRFYRLPTERDVAAVKASGEELERKKKAHVGHFSLVPDEPTPLGGGSGAGRAFSQRKYGMDTFGDLFAPRQALALSTLARLACAHASDSEEIDEALSVMLAICVDRVADKCASLVFWHDSREFVDHVFARQALTMTWNFAEAPVLTDIGWDGAVEWVARAIEGVAASKQDATGYAVAATATVHPLSDDSAQALISDPPYYDAVPYSDLSDFFYVWLRRSLPSALSGAFVDSVTPKMDECIVDETKGKDNTYFERMMCQSLAEGRRVLAHNGVGVIVFAHKSTSGWEALLQAVQAAGWIVTGSWPIDTEMATRIRAKGSAALASSIHLVCRPRETASGALTDTVGDWRDVLAELPGRIRSWLPRLAREGVVGADAIFACLGPALEIFSRYARVEKTSGEPVALREYLEHVWAAVSREALSMIFEQADVSGFEEDARLTAMWLWTLGAGAEASLPLSEAGAGDADADSAPDVDEDEDDGGRPGAKLSGYVLEFDAARKIAQGLGANLDELGGLVQVKGDKARLLPVRERLRTLFGKGGVEETSVRRPKRKQMSLFEESAEYPAGVRESESVGELVAPPGATTLDRVHQAMLLFAFAQGDQLRRFLVDEGVGADQRFWRLAQALSALYPSASEEKRWVDGVLARKKALGLG